MGYEDRLRKLAVHGIGAPAGPGDPPAVVADQHSLGMARLAALIATGGSVASYSELTDAALGAGATPEECAAILEGIGDIVGMARVVEAAPKLAIALGCDIEEP